MRNNLDNYPYYTHPTSKAPEWQMRTRRTEEFALASGLLPVGTSRKDHRAIKDAISKIMSLDHLSYWRDGLGNAYVLNEPYYLNCSSPDPDFPFIELPHALSPYCGGFSDKPGAIPGTVSILACDKSSSQILIALEKKLSWISRMTSPWNEKL